MAIFEPGVDAGSDHFFFSPSPLALSLHFYITSIGRFKCDKPYDVYRENFHSYLFLFVMSGQLNVEVPEATFSVCSGEVMLLDCHKRHHYYAAEPCEFIFVHFDGATSDGFYQAIIQKHSQHVTVRDDWGILENMLTMLNALKEHVRPRESEISLKLNAMLCAIMDASSDTAREKAASDAMGQAIHFIHEHYTEPMSVSDAASFVKLSTYYFSRCFKRETGMTPYQYIMLLRINRAKQLLHTTRKPVATIAQMCGFASDANFVYAFSQHVGMSPGSFRRIAL